MVNSASKRGLHGKYQVEKNGEPVEECFVLESESDPAARAALQAYADATENETLAGDIHKWVSEEKRQGTIEDFGIEVIGGECEKTEQADGDVGE